MDLKAAFALAIPIGIGLAALGSGIGLGRAVGSALEAISRQPDSFTKITQNMFIGCALIEGITIIVIGIAIYFAMSAQLFY